MNMAVGKAPRVRAAYLRGSVVAWLKENWPGVDWEFLNSALPEVVHRSRWNELADRHGLPVRRGTMQNYDSQGRGPARCM